jgi:hypothetical protein
MIIRYRQSIYYVYFAENKQRNKQFNIIDFLLIKYINNILIIYFSKL